MNGLYTIDFDLSFLDELASRLVMEGAKDALSLTKTTIFLPTRRACRELETSFLRLYHGKPVLLPRMIALGNMDEGTDFETLPVENDPLKPPIAPLERQFLLAKQILQLPDMGAAPDRAIELAATLGKLIDQVEIEELSFGSLDNLVPDQYAAHWQTTLEFLKIVTEFWPQILDENDAADPVTHQLQRIDNLSKYWQKYPPKNPVIIAGSTGSIPAVGRLMQTVSATKNGTVILPGLDKEMNEQMWENIPPTHPQFTMKRLLDRIGISRSRVKKWPNVTKVHPRMVLGNAMMASSLSNTTDIPEQAAKDITRIDCSTQDEEAGVIALILREALNTQGQTAALITPDRSLAARVIAICKRWDIEINDSAGKALSHCPRGTFLSLIAKWAIQPESPILLLDLLKHPLSNLGMDKEAFQTKVKLLEKYVLRGPRPAEGLDGLSLTIEQTEHMHLAGSAALELDLTSWFSKISKAAEPFVSALNKDTISFATLLTKHLEFAETLAGRDALWSAEDGEAAAALLTDAIQAAKFAPILTGIDYPSMFTSLLATASVRPRWGTHPRLSILGPLEARLIRPDVVVLGGLTEDSWPALPKPDPWMSRPMKKNFGLPDPDIRIGQSAHDFIQHFGSNKLYLTHAGRAAGSVCVPSRWLSRLDVVLSAAGLHDRLDDGARYKGWNKDLDRPLTIAPCQAPNPCPPVRARPRRLSVTAIEKWMRDPYQIFARYILNLRPLDPLDMDPDAARRGELIHNVLERAVLENAEDETDLMRIARTIFAPYLDRPDVRSFWWPRMTNIASWFLTTQSKRQMMGYDVLATECNGQVSHNGPGGTFTLFARADRIDETPDAELEIIDYKTGQPPSKDEVLFGKAPQLPLEAIIAQLGGFPQVPPMRVSKLAYWKLGHTCDILYRESDLDEAWESLCTLVDRYDMPTTSYPALPDPRYGLRYNDFEHLERLDEWASEREKSS